MVATVVGEACIIAGYVDELVVILYMTRNHEEAFLFKSETLSAVRHGHHGS